MKSVRNAIRALQLFSEETPELSVSRVSEHLGIPKSSASRMLAAMKDGGIVEQEPRGRTYRPGILALRLGTIYASQSSHRETLSAAMRELARETRHSCWVSALSGTDIVVLEGIHGGYPIRLVVEAGSRLPAHATAAGKALLARLDDQQVKALYPTGRLAAFTGHTLRDVEQLLRELAEVRSQRLAATRQEVIDGITSYATAFRMPGDGSYAALSVSFPVANVLAEEEKAVQARLLKISVDLGQRLFDDAWGPARS